MGGSFLGIIQTVQEQRHSKDGKQKGEMMKWHKTFGLLMLGAFIPRLQFRLRFPDPVKSDVNILLRAFGHLGSLIQYAFMFILPTTGFAMGYYSGNGIPFFDMKVPGAEVKIPEIAKEAQRLHTTAGRWFEQFLMVHIGAAVFHTALGHKVLARMSFGSLFGQAALLVGIGYVGAFTLQYRLGEKLPEPKKE